MLLDESDLEEVVDLAGQHGHPSWAWDQDEGSSSWPLSTAKRLRLAWKALLFRLGLSGLDPELEAATGAHESAWPSA
jgi:hypothetical protein